MSQISFQVPTVFTALVGIVLSLIFIRRYKLPAIVTLLASLIMVISSVGIVFLQWYLFSQRYATKTMTAAEFFPLTNMIGLVGTVIRGLCTIVLTIAIFIGRKGTSSTAT